MAAVTMEATAAVSFCGCLESRLTADTFLFPYLAQFSDEFIIRRQLPAVKAFQRIAFP